MNLYLGLESIETTFTPNIELTLVREKVESSNHIYTFRISDKCAFWSRGEMLFDVRSRVDVIFYIKKIQNLLSYVQKEFNPSLIEDIISRRVDFINFPETLNINSDEKEEIKKIHLEQLPIIIKVSDLDLVCTNMNAVELISMENNND